MWIKSIMPQTFITLEIFLIKIKFVKLILITDQS